MRSRVWSAIERTTARILPGLSVRDGAIGLNEVAVVSASMSNRVGSSEMAVDIGAHHGHTVSILRSHGWQVLAVEPDSVNRRRLVERFAGDSGVVVDPRAVSDRSERSVLFRSPTSDGISSLTAFHHDHEAGETVDVVKLHELLDTHGVARIAVLKIDAEGEDAAILRGYDWSRMPTAVICEFEDGKQGGSGSTFAETKSLLKKRGYRTIAMEWHPIEAYGQRHRFRRIRIGRCSADAEGWGNIIAVQSFDLYVRLLLRCAVLVWIGRVANYVDSGMRE